MVLLTWRRFTGLSWLFMGAANSDAKLYDDEIQSLVAAYPDNFRVDYALSREQKNKKVLLATLSFPVTLCVLDQSSLVPGVLLAILLPPFFLTSCLKQQPLHFGVAAPLLFPAGANHESRCVWTLWSAGIRWTPTRSFAPISLFLDISCSLCQIEEPYLRCCAKESRFRVRLFRPCHLSVTHRTTSIARRNPVCHL